MLCVVFGFHGSSVERLKKVVDLSDQSCQLPGFELNRCATVKVRFAATGVTVKQVRENVDATGESKKFWTLGLKAFELRNAYVLPRERFRCCCWSVEHVAKKLWF